MNTDNSVQEQPLSLNGLNNHTITGLVCYPPRPHSVLVIAHGMAEHAERYSDFARWMAARDIAVVTMNHRGHGPDCTADQLGHYSDTHGWAKVVDDLHRVLVDARERFPGVSLTLLGHSMGSFIAQSCAQQHPDALDTLILSATNRINRPELWVSGFLINGIRRFHGKHHRSPLIAKVSFGKFNRMFQPNRTDCDWLSRDTTQVDKYCADPLCGFECTTGLWHDFIQGMLTIKPPAWRKDLPVHLFSGTNDPVGEMGKGVGRHLKAIRQAGVYHASLKLFEGGRHEMLNETNADEVRDYVLSLIISGSPLNG